MAIRDLKPFFMSPFNTRDLSLNDTLALSTDHMERLEQENELGEFDWSPQVGALSAALQTLESAIDDDLVKAGLRKARKRAKDFFRETTIRKQVEKIEAVAILKFDDSSDPRILELFPQGRSIFASCPDDSLRQHLSALKTAATNQETTLGPEATAMATSLLDSWNTIYEASEASTAQKAMTEEQRRQARQGVYDVLFDNLLDAAKRYPNQPDVLGRFFQPTLAGGAPVSGGSTGTGTGAAAGGGDGGEDPESSSSSSSMWPEESSSSSSSESSSSSMFSSSSSSSESSSSSSM